MAIKSQLATLLERALNRYLTLDPDYQHKLAPLTGSVIALTVQPLNETVYLYTNSQGILCLSQCDVAPDVEIKGSLMALGLMGVSAKPMRSLFSGQVSLEGNAQLGRLFQRLLQDLEIDLQHHLSPVLGNALATVVTNIGDSFLHWLQDSATAFKLNTSELLQEETRDLPAPLEAEHFYRQIDTLRHDYDRLQARVTRLEQSLTPPPETSAP